MPLAVPQLNSSVVYLKVQLRSLKPPHLEWKNILLAQIPGLDWVKIRSEAAGNISGPTIENIVNTSR